MVSLQNFIAFLKEQQKESPEDVGKAMTLMRDAVDDRVRDLAQPQLLPQEVPISPHCVKFTNFILPHYNKSPNFFYSSILLTPVLCAYRPLTKHSRAQCW